MPTVNILMCTHNGAEHLSPQLQSFLDQTHTDWRLWVSDDGSVDNTVEILKQFAEDHPDRNVEIFGGPRTGIGANFLSLFQRAQLDGSWVAFADQDDVWMSHKLQRAVEMLEAAPGDRKVYASRTLLTDHSLKVKGPSKEHLRPYSFANALVQNVLAGNTLLLPPQTTDLVRASLDAAVQAQVPFHDWWIYQICTGADVEIIIDPEPSLYYRQHHGNQLGGPRRRGVMRLKLLQKRIFGAWMDRNLTALHSVRHLLSDDHRSMLTRVAEWRATPPAQRRETPKALGLYRQRRSDDFLLHALAKIGWL